MEKEFIPYEQALALKELGFDEPCFWWYDFEKELRKDRIGVESINSKYFIDSKSCSAPLYSQSFRWFREKHNLFHEIQIDRTAEPKFCFDIFQYEHFGNYEEIRIGEWYLYRTQEEAELECLKKLIEIVKNK